MSALIILIVVCCIIRARSRGRRRRRVLVPWALLGVCWSVASYGKRKGDR